MSDARRCDGPGCGRVSVEPHVGWWQLEAATLALVGLRERLDFCSWECLGAFVFDQAGQVREAEEQLEDSG